MKSSHAHRHAPSRAYRQTARAEAAAQRETRIVGSFRTLLERRWLDGFTLQDVADGAGVTQQTVIRKFGGKEGLLEALIEAIRLEITERRTVPAGAVDRGLELLMEDYEATGDLVLRLLSQEERFPMLTRFLDIGRRAHRSWVAALCAPWLLPLKADLREEALDALVAATDLYLWRLFRRDLGYDRARTARVFRRLMGGVLNGLKLETGKGSRS